MSDTEKAVLGAMLVDNRCIGDVAEVLGDGKWFDNPAHRHAYAAALDLFNDGTPVDTITLPAELTKRGQLESIGLPTIVEWAGYAVSGARAAHHASIVLRTGQKRHLADVLSEARTEALSEMSDPMEIMDRVEGRLLEMAGTEKKQAESLGAILPTTMGEVEEAHNNPGRMGIPTSLSDLDDITGGWHNTDLVILAARPSVGKTALGLGNALAAAERGPVAVYGLEMSKNQYAMRLLSMRAKVDLHKMRTGRMGQGDWQTVTRHLGQLAELPIYIDDTPGMSPLELRAKARRLKGRHGLSLVVVDYLQLMRYHEKTQSREQEVSKISQSLKNLAKELNVPVLALSQLSRASEARSDKRPILADLRDSGAIEQDADTVVFIHPQMNGGERTGVCELIVAKQRSGPVGSVYVQFDAPSATFQNLAHTEVR